MPSSYLVLSSRLICALFLHLQAEVFQRNSLQMMKYITNHGDEFNMPFVGWLLGLIYFWVVFTIEVCCICKMCTCVTFLTTIHSFVYYMAIVNLPEFSYGALPPNSAIKRSSSEILITNFRRDNLEFSCGFKAMRFFYKVNRALYAGFFFYFMPFLALVLPFFTLSASS
jgi:hypothetical protein